MPSLPLACDPAGAVIAVLAEWATAADHGLFAAVSRTHDRALWFLQPFLAVVFLGGLMMAAAVAEVSRAQAALRASQAVERNRLARELHDSVSQALFSMTMHAGTAQLALAKAGLAENSPAARAVARLRTLTAGALAEKRALIFELRPGALKRAWFPLCGGRQPRSRPAKKCGSASTAPTAG